MTLRGELEGKDSDRGAEVKKQQRLCGNCQWLDKRMPVEDWKNAGHIREHYCIRSSEDGIALGFIDARLEGCEDDWPWTTPENRDCWITCTGDGCENGSNSLDGWHEVYEDECVFWTHTGRCPECGPDPWQPPAKQRQLFDQPAQETR